MTSVTIPSLTIVESPFAGNTPRNLRYLHQCLLDSLSREEIPFASHAFFTQFLDDSNPTERLQGIRLGLRFYNFAKLCAVYEDFGISPGMAYGIEHAERLAIPIETRRLPPYRMAIVTGGTESS